MSTSSIPPVIDQLSDADLMASISLGDEGAFRSLYDRHSPIVFALCRRILDDRRDAEDVLLEVFWEIWDRASRYDPTRGSVRTYVVMLARCRAIDRARQTHRRQEATFTSLQATWLFSGEKTHHQPY